MVNLYYELPGPLTNIIFFPLFSVESSIYYSAYADRPYPADPYLAAATSGIGPVAGYGVSWVGPNSEEAMQRIELGK